MVWFVFWMVVALGTAVVVIGAASVGGDRTGGLGTLLVDMRAGLRGWRANNREPAVVVPEPEPVDTTLDELFASAPVGDDYLQVDDLAETLTWAREQATRASRSVGLLRR